MLALQGKVRATRERKRRSESAQRNHYTNIFEPITNSLVQQKPSQVEKVDVSTDTTGSGLSHEECNCRKKRKGSGMYLNPYMGRRYMK